MSTILNALKKLEQEREAQRAQSTTDIPALNTRRAVKRAVRALWLHRLGPGLAASVLIMLVVAGAAVLGYSRLAKRTTPAPLPQSEPSRVQAPAPPPNSTAPIADLPAKVQDRVRGEAQARASVHPHEASVPTAAPAVIPESSPVPPKAHSAAPQRASGKQAAVEAAPRLSDGRLKVQAIVWAPVAADRMAVINNHIVREGNPLDAFTVAAIGEDYVLVREGDRTWKVLFGQP